PSMARSLILDHFAIGTSAVILIGAMITTWSAIDYLPAQQADHHEYYGLVALATMGMMGMVMAADLLTLFVALEVMSIAVYILVGFKRQSPFATEGALKYFVLGSFASALLLLGIAFLYGVTGDITLTGIAAAFDKVEGVANDPLATIGMILVIAAFAFKIAAAPFHMWIPDVYEGALTSVTGLMAVAVKTAGFAAFLRIMVTCFGDETFKATGAMGPSWELIIAGLAVASMVIGNLMALGQSNLKRMLAYSAVAHTGYMLLAFLATSTVGENTPPLNTLGGGLMIYFLAYTLANAAAFSVAAALGDANREDISEPAYAGLAKRDPGLAMVLAVAMLSLLGIPATAGFVGKLTIFVEVLEQGNPLYLWLVIIAVINSVVSAWYYLRVILVAYMTDEVEGVTLIQSRPLRFGAVIATVLTLAVGLLPGNVIDSSEKAGRSLARTANPGQLGGDASERPATQTSIDVRTPAGTGQTRDHHGRRH
ncbi:MAG: NADH-quinone oxidoreductase subunit N, partial [Myxococcota bacterium]|nr:NADH-quinone oxidoreductase subunit N [Myxococcota bacterium]